MADDESATAKPQKIHRVRIGLNVLVQIAILLVLAIMVNYLGFEHYRRWDLSRDQKYALSDKTKRFLQSMKGKARITVFFMSEQPDRQRRAGMLTEYQYAAKGKLDVENIDPERNLSRAKELFDKYKVVTGESLLILDYEGRNKTVKASEMAEIDQGNPMFGEPPKVTAFKGEQAITSALMELVEGKKNTLGYVLGHKEPPIAEPPPSRDADGGDDQPDQGAEDIHREREHQVPGIESLRSRRDSRRAQDHHDQRSAVRFLRSRNEIAPRFLGEAGAHPALARSRRENAEAQRFPERAGREGE